MTFYYVEFQLCRWISEKMDGVRAYWDGQKLWSRQGKELAVPEQLTLGLPSGMCLDGELWMGRGTYEKLMHFLSSNQPHWNDVQYYIFDLPSAAAPYQERMELLKQL